MLEGCTPRQGLDSTGLDTLDTLDTSLDTLDTLDM